jgi:hypothetical protein
MPLVSAGAYLSADLLLAGARLVAWPVPAEWQPGSCTPTGGEMRQRGGGGCPGWRLAGAGKLARFWPIAHRSALPGRHLASGRCGHYAGADRAAPRPASRLPRSPGFCSALVNVSRPCALRRPAFGASPPVQAAPDGARAWRSGSQTLLLIRDQLTSPPIGQLKRSLRQAGTHPPGRPGPQLRPPPWGRPLPLPRPAAQEAADSRHRPAPDRPPRLSAGGFTRMAAPGSVSCGGGAVRAAVITVVTRELDCPVL